MSTSCVAVYVINGGWSGLLGRRAVCPKNELMDLQMLQRPFQLLMQRRLRPVARSSSSLLLLLLLLTAFRCSSRDLYAYALTNKSS